MGEVIYGLSLIYVMGVLILFGFSLNEGWNTERRWETPLVILLWPFVFGIIHPITHAHYRRWSRLYDDEAGRVRRGEPRTMTDKQRDELWRKMCR